MKVSLKEYARIHGLNHSTVRSYVLKGWLHVIDRDGRFTYVDSNEEITGKGTSYAPKYGDQSQLLNIFRQMKGRCYNPNNPSYAAYGGRGIRICDEWLNDRSKFLDWALSHGYQPGLTIDKIDNDGNYCPENCQWLTRGENSRKRKYDHLLKKACCV